MAEKLRENILSNGQVSFYLDIYHNKKRWYEFLNIYVNRKKQAIHLIMSGEVVNYRYDMSTEEIVKK